MTTNLQTFFHRLILWLGAAQMTLVYSSEVPDYPSLKHKVFIETLRAGNHDASGVNEYFFMYQLSAIKNGAEEQGKEIDQRPIVQSDLKEFAKVSIQSLSLWDAGLKDESALSFTIEGSVVRELVSRAMRELSAKEMDIGLEVNIKMFEKRKWLYFFGEDTLVGTVNYFPIPTGSFQTPERTNLKLEIVDDLGTKVIIKVKYDQPRTEKKKFGQSVKVKDTEVTTSTPTPNNLTKEPDSSKPTR